MLRQVLLLLAKRRKELGMPFEVLARRSGVSVPTLKRMLSGQSGAHFDTVEAVAKALEVTIHYTENMTAHEQREREAERVANRIVDLVQGTSGLEAQGLPDGTRREMVLQTVHELMAGSQRRLWDVA